MLVDVISGKAFEFHTLKFEQICVCVCVCVCGGGIFQQHFHVFFSISSKSARRGFEFLQFEILPEKRVLLELIKLMDLVFYCITASLFSPFSLHFEL